MKRFSAAAAILMLLVLCCAAAQGEPWYGETVGNDTAVRWSWDESSEVQTVLPARTRVKITGSTVGYTGELWYQVKTPGTEWNGWIREAGLAAEDKPAYLPEGPAIREKDETYAADRRSAYAAVLRRRQDGLENYARLQAEDNDVRGYWGDFAGNSPLYTDYIDITGDGQPELLFMATPDGLEEWETESADLFVYAWRGDHAEQILWGGTIFAVAGNGPWYEIYLDEDNRWDLYVRYGCDAPGSLNCYRLNEDGQYALVKSTAGYTDYEAETTEYYDGCTYYVDGMVAPKAEYDAAMAEMEVEHKIMIASTEEPIR